jgi:hypothetical protein
MSDDVAARFFLEPSERAFLSPRYSAVLLFVFLFFTLGS